MPVSSVAETWRGDHVLDEKSLVLAELPPTALTDDLDATEAREEEEEEPPAVDIYKPAMRFPVVPPDEKAKPKKDKKKNPEKVSRCAAHSMMQCSTPSLFISVPCARLDNFRFLQVCKSKPLNKTTSSFPPSDDSPFTPNAMFAILYRWRFMIPFPSPATFTQEAAEGAPKAPPQPEPVPQTTPYPSAAATQYPPPTAPYPPGYSYSAAYAAAGYPPAHFAGYYGYGGQAILCWRGDGCQAQQLGTAVIYCFPVQRLRLISLISAGVLHADADLEKKQTTDPDPALAL